MEHSPLIKPKAISGLPEIVGPEFEAKWVDGLTNEHYHADRTAISSSPLKILLQQTPAHFRSAWLTGPTVDEEKDHFRYGSLAHMALLEPDRFRSSYVLEPIFEAPTKEGKMSTQSKAAREQKKEWYESLDPGTLVVTEKDFEAITGSIESIIAHEKASKVIVGAQTEKSGYFRHPLTGIKCRIRPDIIHIDKRVVIDFKTTRDAGREFFSKEIARHMYHMSLAFYGMGIKEITGWEPEIYAILAVEKEPPYAVALYTLKQATIETAKAWCNEGLDILKKCIEMDKWPSHQEGAAEDIDIPEWAHRKELPMFDFGDEA